MYVSDFDFDLPERLIAQAPVERGTSKLLVLHRNSLPRGPVRQSASRRGGSGEAAKAGGEIEHSAIARLYEFLREGDLLIVNDTKVFPARLLGTRVPSGGAVECLLLSNLDETRWDALVHPGQKLQPGSRMAFHGPRHVLHGEILERHFHGRRTIRLWTENAASVDQVIDEMGHIPLPPYVKRADEPGDRERYQTVYARERGSVAAPTAGLHFTPELLERLDTQGVERAAITLHVGYVGTFQPVRADLVEAHVLEPEYFSISESAAEIINRAKREGRRIVAVGTTTTRALEAAARAGRGVITPQSGWTDLFIYPGFHFRLVDALMTNFHLPRSSLLMLVCALAGREAVLAAYREAIEREYRFYSYGDAMLIL